MISNTLKKLYEPVYVCEGGKVNTAFGLFNVAHTLSTLCLFLFPAALVFMWYLFIGIIPLIIWMIISITFFVIETVASILYAIHQHREANVKQVFTTFEVSNAGVCTIGVYAWLIKLVSCVLMWITGVGFVSIFATYALGIVALTLAVQVVNE